MATIRDVARAAGVSVATVSRALNNHARVRTETRSRVNAAAHALDYTPNPVARSLITSRTHAFGVLLPDLYGEFFSEVLRGIDLRARRDGFHLLVSSSHADGEDMVDALRSMRGRIEGLIVMAPDVDTATLVKAAGAGFPLVLLDPGLRVVGCDSISIDNEAGAVSAVDHLVRLGHRRLATITGPAQNADAQQRLHGFRWALAERGLASDPELEVEGDFTEPSGYAAVGRLLAATSRPTAIFAANDYMAIGAMSALTQAGLRVPEDMAIVGFDDIAMARYLNPPLTTVSVDLVDLGARAVERLLRNQTGASTRRRHDVTPATLVVRRSCGSPSAGPESRSFTPRARRSSP
jgi:LacI family transcriptional regulator, galactose operon repressor